MALFDDILSALSSEAEKSFAGMVTDFDKDVLPAMASLAQNMVTIAGLQANPAYTVAMAQADFAAQVDAAVSVLIRFANATLIAVQTTLNALLGTVSATVNRLIGFPLLPLPA